MQIASWYFAAENNIPNFVREKDGYIFPKRLLDKHFNEDGSINPKALTFKNTVKKYWQTYHSYKNYRDLVKNNPQLKYEKAKYQIPDIKFLPYWFEIMINKSIKKAEGEKANLYLQSELYRKKLDALMAFAAVNELELQAHFAPVGLMFNQGTLSDWDKYQDQTIWDRIREAGKDIFYRVEYSSQNIGIPERIKQDKAYTEGKGKELMVSTSIANNAKVKEWIDKAKGEMAEESGWLADIKAWWQGDKEYDGSGWGHGARTELAKAIGFEDGKIDNIFEAGVYSMLQRGEVIIDDKSKLKKSLNEDPELKDREKIISRTIVNDSRYLKESFKIELPVKSIQFGGKRAKGAMWKQFVNPLNSKYRDTWKVAANDLSWLVRSVGLYTTANIKKDGNVKFEHTFNDKFDLRPSVGRDWEYNVVNIILGFLYHDAAGGNDLMRIKADWHNEYTKEKVDWMANGDKYFRSTMDNIKQQQNSLNNELEKADQWNRNTSFFENLE